MPITKSNLSDQERLDLATHASKYKVYPYRYRINRTVNAANFTKADPSSTVKYYTRAFKANEVLPIISFATSLILTPNTSVGLFGLALSYNSVFDLSDGTTDAPDEEGTIIYQILSNGGAINDFQVFYPTDWYMERTTKIYLHVFADNTRVAAADTTAVGHVVLGTMPTGV